MIIHDELGRELTLHGIPQRIVSLVPSLTEYLFWLGAAERVIAATTFCVAPAEVEHVPKIGGTKNPDCAQIIALQPDLIIASKEENRQRDVQRLTEAGVSVYVTDVTTVAGARTTLSQLASLVGCAAAAAPLLAEIDAELAHVIAPGPRVLAAVWRDPWMWIGADTYADDLLTLCGGINVARAWSGRYPRRGLDSAESQADILLLPDEPYQFSSADQFEIAHLAPRVVLCDGQLLTWYGPRISQALHYWRRMLNG